MLREGSVALPDECGGGYGANRGFLTSFDGNDSAEWVGRDNRGGIQQDFCDREIRGWRRAGPGSKSRSRLVDREGGRA